MLKDYVMENTQNFSPDDRLAPRYSTTANNPIVILLNDQLIITEINESAVSEFFHQKKAEILNQPFAKLLAQQGINEKEVIAQIKYSEHALFHRSKLYQPRTKKSYELAIICIHSGEKTSYALTLRACNNESYNNLKAYINAIINNLPGAVYWKDKDGCYIGCNKFVAEMAGFEFPEQMIGKTDHDLCWKEFADDWQTLDQEVMQTGCTMIREEKVKLANGMILTELTHKTPLRNEYNEIIGIIGTSLDITDRKKAEKDLKEAKELAESANKVKTEFLANMRHDLRTPFSGILGLAEVMAEKETDAEKRENLFDIAESARALLNHVNEIFEFVQVESGQLPILEKQFDVYKLLNHTLHILLPSAKDKGLNLSFNLSNDLPQFLLGDAVRTQRILMNLISNAIKFTKEGNIKVEVQVADRLDTKIVLNFVIDDTGPGIPEDKQDIIFERFNRLTSSYSGVYPGKGLGLKIVRQFLEEIGGQIYLTSKLGKGTQFKILIPYQLSLLTDLVTNYEANEQRKSTFNNLSSAIIREELITKDTINIERKKPSTQQAISKINKVLLVEDHTIAAKIAKMILSDLGCEVDIAETGKIALNLIEKNHYDLIFMDIGLPDMDGCAVIEQLRSHRLQRIVQIPIVALTAHAETDEKQRCLDVGVNIVITKPLTKKWAESVLSKLIPKREKQKRQVKEVAEATADIKPTEKIVDIEYAKTLLGGNETVVQEMLMMLVDSLPEEISALEAAHQQKDWQQLKNLAHKLKGGSSYCGTLRLKSACTELDSYIKSGLTEKIPELYQCVLAEINAVQEFIKTQSSA